MRTLVLAAKGKSRKLFYQLRCGNQRAQNIRFSGEGLTFSGLNSKTEGNTFNRAYYCILKT